MLSIYPINFNTLNKNIPTKNPSDLKKFDGLKDHAVKNYTIYPIASYNTIFNISFSGGRTVLSLEEQVKRLNLENLPPALSKNILEALNQKTEKNLYDIHTEFFSPLLECKTLDEAKAIYPWFQNIIDAKDLPEYLMSPTLKKIKNGEIEGVTLENLSLAILKAHYGKGAGLSARDKFFGLSKDATIKLFSHLQIERLDGKYLRLLSDCSPERRERTSSNWSKEKRAEHAKKANEIWSSEEKRQAQSKKRKEWFNEHPEGALEISQRMQGTTLSAKTKAKISAIKKDFYKHNPEFITLRKKSFKEIAEFQNIMREIARKEFPYLRIIFIKHAADKPLEDYEVKYLERYYKRCEEVYPGGQKMAGELFSKMWQNFKENKNTTNASEILQENND